MESLARGRLERWQGLVYLAAVLAGAGLGGISPGLGEALGGLVWPLLGMLLLSTFLQVSAGDLRIAIADRRFLAALLGGNFVAVPLVVLGLSLLLPDDPSIRLGFFLVLLAPCTDWFNTFSYLGRGDARLSTAATPLLLLVQLLLLPLFIALAVGLEAAAGMRAQPFLLALVGIILAPLAVAAGVQALARRRPAVARAVSGSSWLPVPLLAGVLLVVAASKLQAVVESAPALLRVAGLFGAYVVIAPLLAVAAARLARLRGPATRTVVFSLGTRNSFVILPLVLAWPGAGELAVAVVVLQSLVELGGMLAYVALVPRLVGDDVMAR